MVTFSSFDFIEVKLFGPSVRVFPYPFAVVGVRAGL